MRWISIVCLLLGAVSQASALEVREVVWGFDGKAVPSRLNLLSVLVVNASQHPYDGVLVLRKKAGPGHDLGAGLAEPCFVAPYASRWLQFSPYVQQERELWSLAWGEASSQRIEFRSPPLGPPARVLLTAPDETFGLTARVRVFTEDLFPTTVAATDGLHSVVLDHTPRWEPVRREAFLDWLRRGGTVHLLLGRDGEYPQFAAELGELNLPLDRFRVGAGLVVRHSVTRRELTDELLESRGHPKPVLEETRDPAIFSVEDVILPALSKMTRPEHRWGPIYLMVVIYILLVGPVNYLLGRKWRDYRLTILFFLLMVVGFGYAFSVVGRRGYGETAAVHSLSYARPVEGNRFDVTQWTNVFVTSGKTYTVTHPASHNLYSTCQQLEAVRGVIHNGKDGKFDVDIPLYSSRAFLHRARMTGHNLALQVTAWREGETLESLGLATGPGFPAGAQAWALHRGRFYPLEVGVGRLSLRSTTGRRARDFLSSDRLRVASVYQFGYSEPRYAAQSPEAMFREMAPLLIARGLGGTDAFQYRIKPGLFQDDWLQVFVLAESPAGLRMSQGFGREMGYVLYHLSFERPENRDD